jgi:hypothetical protein
MPPPKQPTRTPPDASRSLPTPGPAPDAPFRPGLCPAKWDTAACDPPLASCGQGRSAADWGGWGREWASRAGCAAAGRGRGDCTAGAAKMDCDFMARRCNRRALSCALGSPKATREARSTSAAASGKSRTVSGSPRASRRASRAFSAFLASLLPVQTCQQKSRSQARLDRDTISETYALYKEERTVGRNDRGPQEGQKPH